MKRATLVCLIMAVLVCGVGAAQAILPPRPTLAIEAEDGTVYEGILADYCWMEDTPDGPQEKCDFSLERPDAAVPVGVGETITVVFQDTEAGLPESLELIFEENLDAQGEPIRFTLEPDAPEWVVDLEEGVHPVRVEAGYEETLGYIAYLFELEVSAPEPTATPTEEPTATRTPTQEAEAPPTEEPTATKTPTQEVEETSTEEPTATKTPTQGVEETPTEEPTATETPTSGPSPTPSRTPRPTVAPLSDMVDATKVMLESAGMTYHPVGVNYCSDPDDLQSCEYCPDPANETCDEIGIDQLADDRLVTTPMGAFLVRMEEPLPASMDLIVQTADGAEELDRERRAGESVMLYTPPVTDLGSYILAVETHWPQGNATFYFQFLVANTVLDPNATAVP